jgi:hypothetical protein
MRNPKFKRARHRLVWGQCTAYLAFALLAGGGRASADTVFHDDFNGLLNPAWSIVRADASYYSLQSTGLVLRCNSGDLWGGYNSAKNVFLVSNPAPGDFTVTAKLRWLVPPAVNWAQFDLLAYDNDDNHVRIDYTYSSGSLGIGRIAETGGVISQAGGVRVNFGTAWFWLQVRKEGSTYSAWHSTDGVTFSPATSPFTYGNGHPAMLGFVAMVDLGGQTAQTLIDSFTVEDTVGVPLLTIFRTVTNTVVVSWPSPWTGWTLQHNTNLNTTNWVSPPETVTDDGTNKCIVADPPLGIRSCRFYRLFKL